MSLLKALSETPIGRALIAYFLDLPRWTLMNLLFAVALMPAFVATLSGLSAWMGLLTFPVVPLWAGIINMAARETRGEAPGWRDMLAQPATYQVAAVIWLALVAVLAVLLAEPSAVVIFILCGVALTLLLVGVFALFIPALLKMKFGLAWRNGLMLAVHYPIVAFGLLALLIVGAWAVWITRGALVLLIPSLWTMIAVFSVQDRIQAVQSSVQPD